MADTETAQQGFGYDPIETTSFFVVLIPREADEEVSVYLCPYSADGTACLTDADPIASIEQTSWNAIESRLRVYLNLRLRGLGRPPGLWRFGENRLSDTIGREVALLLTALEESDETEANLIYDNWRRLAPEERRWLYGRAAAAPPGEHTEVGWRRAAQVALRERPALAPRLRARETAEEPTAAGELPQPREAAASRRRKAQEEEGQLRLL